MNTMATIHRLRIDSAIGSHCISPPHENSYGTDLFGLLSAGIEAITPSAVTIASVGAELGTFQIFITLFTVQRRRVGYTVPSATKAVPTADAIRLLRLQTR